MREIMIFLLVDVKLLSPPAPSWRRFRREVEDEDEPERAGSYHLTHSRTTKDEAKARREGKIYNMQCLMSVLTVPRQKFHVLSDWCSQRVNWFFKAHTNHNM